MSTRIPTGGNDKSSSDEDKERGDTSPSSNDKESTSSGSDDKLKGAGGSRPPQVFETEKERLDHEFNEARKRRNEQLRAELVEPIGYLPQSLHHGDEHEKEYKGTVGQPLNIYANYWACLGTDEAKSKLDQNSKYAQIDVKIKRKGDEGAFVSKWARQEALRKLPQDVLPRNSFTYDNNLNVYLPVSRVSSAIRQGGNWDVTVRTFTRTVAGNAGPDSRPGGGARREEEIVLNVTLTATKNEIDADSSPMMLVVWNTALKNSLVKHVGLTRGRGVLGDLYDMSEERKLSNDISLVRGFSLSIVPVRRGIHLNVDRKYMVLRHRTVYEAMRATGNKAAVIAAFVGRTVFNKQSRRFVKIDGIAFDKRIDQTFSHTGADGKAVETTIKDYYLQRYACTLEEAKQPLLMEEPSERDKRAGRNTPALIPPEVCVETGLTDAERQNDQLMKAHATFTKKSAAEKFVDLDRAVHQYFIKQEVQADMAALGLRLDCVMDQVGDKKFEEHYQPQFSKQAKIKGRLLPPAKIVFQDQRGNSKEIRIDVNKGMDWTRETFCAKAYNLPEVLNSGMRFGLVCTKRDETSARNFVKEMIDVGRAMSVTFPVPRCFTTNGSDAASFSAALQPFTGDKKPHLVVVVVPDDKTERYNEIKRSLILASAVPSQVLRSKTVNSKAKAIRTKVALQVIAKMGGGLWTWSKQEKYRDLMVVGIDTYHSKSGGSMLAMVGNFDDKMTVYGSRTHSQTSREEIGNCIAPLVSSLLLERAETHQRAQQLVIFRDGVGEGQFRQVYNDEALHIANTIAEMSKTSAKHEKALRGMDVTYVIVTKKHTARLSTFDRAKFVVGPAVPGTIVDSFITKVTRNDFYLVSAVVREGTPTPVLYSVLLANGNMAKPDNLQQLAYDCCHLYYNQSGTIKVPHVCQYAHKLAQLSGMNLGASPVNENLGREWIDNKLFYL